MGVIGIVVPNVTLETGQLTMNNGKSLGQRCRDTILKQNRRKEKGFELLIKWSCEFKADLLKNSDLQAIFR